MLRKSFSERDHFPARVQRDAVAVKNQFIVRADGVDLSQRDFFVPGNAPEHFQPHPFLAVVPWRRGKVQNQFRPLRNQFLDRIAAIPPFRPEILVVPNVLANSDADFLSFEIKRRNRFRRFKITDFVENVVGRQQALARAPDNFSVLQNGGGIAQRASGAFGIPVNKADAQRNRAGA